MEKQIKVYKDYIEYKGKKISIFNNEMSVIIGNSVKFCSEYPSECFNYIDKMCEAEKLLKENIAGKEQIEDVKYHLLEIAFILNLSVKESYDLVEESLKKVKV